MTHDADGAHDEKTCTTHSAKVLQLGAQGSLSMATKHTKVKEEKLPAIHAARFGLTNPGDEPCCKGTGIGGG